MSTLVELVQHLGHPRVLVVGDAILDRYIFGNAERVSQEAPVILLRADHDEVRLGGAANVANMVRGLEAEVTLAAVVGADRDGHEEAGRRGSEATRSEGTIVGYSTTGL